MPKFGQKGFTSPVIILALIILGAAVIGIIIYKVSFEETHKSTKENTQTTELTIPSPSPSLKPSLKPTIRPTAKPSIKPSAPPTPQPSQSPNPTSSNNSSGSNNSNNSSASTSPSSTTTPTPAPSTCSGLCFDRGSASVEVTQGSNVESGGSTAFAFNLTGDGSHGFLMNTSGLPAGMDVSPSSGGFGESSLPVKIWVNNNGNVPFGTYSGTITLKQGPSYSQVGTMSITVTYKQP